MDACLYDLGDPLIEESGIFYLDTQKQQYNHCGFPHSSLVMTNKEHYVCNSWETLHVKESGA
jgi:hypothetical protein